MKKLLFLLLILTLSSCWVNTNWDASDYSNLPSSQQEEIYNEYKILENEIVEKWVSIMNQWGDISKMKTIEDEWNKKLEILKQKYSHLELPESIFQEFHKFSF